MKIYKYKVDMENPIKIPLLQLLDIQIQNNEFVCWAIVNPQSYREKKVYVKVFMTGQEVPAEVWRGYNYWHTLQDEMGTVWHVFVRTE